MAQTYEPVKPKQQLGFIHHNVDCIGCRACEIACKDKNGLPPGPRFRRVLYIEGGTFPDVFAYKVNMSCNHCAEPACLPTCPTGAIWKRQKDGVVDIDSTLCIGCRRCEAACPFGAPQYDPQENVVKKCNMCIDELEAGRKPYCVMACMMRVLDIGPIDGNLEGHAEDDGHRPRRQGRTPGEEHGQPGVDRAIHRVRSSPQGQGRMKPGCATADAIVWIPCCGQP